MEVQRELQRCRMLVENRLIEFFQGNLGLHQAMQYSLMAGGKRIRPILTLKFCTAAGGREEDALDVACAVEMLHTYTLIHDDLPCMDDDDLRRGKPTCHRAFGEWQALLAGDALQAEAFGTVLHAPLPAEQILSCGRILAEAAGTGGVCGGQYLDLCGAGTSLTEQHLTEIHHKKTASLLMACCQMGVAAAGGDEMAMESARQYGYYLGMAFQIRDDMLDELSTEAELGKPIGSDRTEGKTTFLTLYGQEGCQRLVEQLTEQARQSLSGIADGVFLCQLADTLCRRTS